MKYSSSKVLVIFLLIASLLVGCTSSQTAGDKRAEKGTTEAGIKISASSTSTGNNSAQKTMDDNLGTYWSATGDGQWIQYELTERKDVAAVNIAFREGNTKSYKFDIQLSENGKTWETKFSGQSSGISRNIESFRLPAIAPARFVRILGHGNSIDKANNYAEVIILTPNDGFPHSNSALNFKPMPAGYKRSHIIDHENFSQNNYPVGTNVTSKTLTPPFYTQATTDYNMTYSDQMVKTGTRSARIELRPYVPNTVGKTTSGNLNKDKTVIRSEILLAKLQEREVWYSVAMFIPRNTTIIKGDTIPGYVADAQYDIITQWHAWDDYHLGEKARNPPMALFLQHGKLAFQKYWSVDSVNLNVKTNIPGKQGLQNFPLGTHEDITGRWLNWTYHFVFDHRPNGQGQIQVWLDGRNLIDDYGPNIFNDKKKYPYFKAGLYRRHFDKGTPKRVLYLDEIYHGDSLATYNDVRTDQ